MVLNKRGDVKRKKGFHRIHRRVEGQLRLETDKRQQGSGLACHPQKGYRAPLHPIFTVSFLNLDPVSTAGRGWLDLSGSLRPHPGKITGPLCSQSPQIYSGDHPQAGVMTLSGMRGQSATPFQGVSFLSGFLSDSLSSHSRIL